MKVVKQQVESELKRLTPRPSKSDESAVKGEVQTPLTIGQFGKN